MATISEPLLRLMNNTSRSSIDHSSCQNTIHLSISPSSLLDRHILLLSLYHLLIIHHIQVVASHSANIFPYGMGCGYETQQCHYRDLEMTAGHGFMGSQIVTLIFPNGARMPIKGSRDIISSWAKFLDARGIKPLCATGASHQWAQRVEP